MIGPVIEFTNICKNFQRRTVYTIVFIRIAANEPRTRGVFKHINEILTKKFGNLTYRFYLCPDERDEHTRLVVATV
jgi:hypothetical protein